MSDNAMVRVASQQSELGATQNGKIMPHSLHRNATDNPLLSNMLALPLPAVKENHSAPEQSFAPVQVRLRAESRDQAPAPFIPNMTPGLFA
jgi:hypothetical protein